MDNDLELLQLIVPVIYIIVSSISHVNDGMENSGILHIIHNVQSVTYS